MLSHRWLDLSFNHIRSLAGSKITLSSLSSLCEGQEDFPEEDRRRSLVCDRESFHEQALDLSNNLIGSLDGVTFAESIK